MSRTDDLNKLGQQHQMPRRPNETDQDYWYRLQFKTVPLKKPRARIRGKQTLCN